ncbi:cytochrome c [Sphingomonas parva]|uniref:Cytochrome c n=1 Tax=Sphingomonas parva TaxID=2555898 RepID=A0A4Y8ZS79_9SPHN|nr:cytochrome c [Sphingomonas parva]TFI58880.1 cytochrome c [Sphingomonas parva]
MSSRSPNKLARIGLAGAALLALGACDREERDTSRQPKPETISLASSDPRAKEYENSSFHISQGQRYYSWMNCSGCHALAGGGGMGPPLSDDEWRYGGRMEDIVQTILKGRPNGMPAFEGRITEQQAWQLAAFVRSLSAQPRQDVLPGRSDDISNAEPQTLEERRPQQSESNTTLPSAEKD